VYCITLGIFGSWTLAIFHSVPKMHNNMSSKEEVNDPNFGRWI